MGELKSIHKRADGTYILGVYEVELPRITTLRGRAIEINRQLIETKMWPDAYGLWIQAWDFFFDERHTRFRLVVVVSGQEESQLVRSIAGRLGWKATDRRIKVKLIASVTGAEIRRKQRRASAIKKLT